MTPTNELRFVERTTSEHDVWHGQHVVRSKTIRVLQQKWVNVEVFPPLSQWRDVPLVKEEVRRAE